MTKTSATGARTRVSRVKAEYPNQLDYSGLLFRRQPLRQLPRRFAGAVRSGKKTERFVALSVVCVRSAKDDGRVAFIYS
eukprot:1190509-Prorocentrum_minimum.AAC.1